MFSSFSRGLAATTVVLMASMNALSTYASSFDSFYQGSPDLVFNVLQQKSATSFAFTICNQGDVSTGNGSIGIVLQSNEGQNEERTYQNMSIPSGSCVALTMYSVDGYKTATKRKSAITGTVRFEGARRELKTDNNQITLAAKKSRVDISQITYNTTSSSSSPTSDLWGSSDNETKWYTSNNTNGSYYNNGIYNTNCNNNSIYATNCANTNGTTWYNSNGNTNYNGTYYNGNGTNGDIRPASPTWAMQQGNQNLVFVYTGYNTGTWYNYSPSNTNNGNYYYTPYTNGTTGTTTTNSYNAFESSAPTSTNQYHIYDVNTGYNAGSTNTYNNNNSSTWYNNNTNTNGNYYNNNGTFNTFAPGNYNSNCPQWVKVWNTGNQSYEWTCSTSYVQPTGNPDLYLANLKQNGGRSELIGKICNQGDSMTVSQQVTVRATNAQYNTSAATYIQLLKGGCTDISIPTANLNFNWFAGTNYLVYAEVDIYNNVSETREDNNASYWRIQIQ